MLFKNIRPTEGVTISEKEVILLGLIAEEPIHAYGLKEKIRLRQMDSWTTIGFSSIYRVLAQLEEKGWIDTHLEHGGQGAIRKVHAISEAGRQALAVGVLEHLGSVKPVKSPFWVGLANITRAPYQQVVVRLEERIAQFDQAEKDLDILKNQHLQEKASSYEQEGEGSACVREARLIIQLIVASALAHLRAERAFMQEALKRLAEEGPEIFPELDLSKGTEGSHEDHPNEGSRS